MSRQHIYALLVLLLISAMPAGILAQSDLSTRGAVASTASMVWPLAQPSDTSASLLSGQPAAPAPAPSDDEIAQAAPPAPPPPQVRHVESQIKQKVRRWHIGGSIGAGFDPELFMFDAQSQIGPIFHQRFLFQPNAVFGFGELTNMFAVNLEGAYRFQALVHGRWTPYFGMGPSLNFIHRAASSKDVSFSNFSYKTGFNVFLGAQKNRTFVEVKTSLWSGDSPVLRLFLGYNF